jgi:MFS family permease
MRPRNLIVSFGIGTLLVACGLMTRGKEGISFFFMGAVMLLSSVAIAVIRRGNPKPPPNNRHAIAGAILGAIAGGSVGYNFPPLGRLIIKAFNPGLPEQDFAAGLGAIGGTLLGGMLGAMLGAILIVSFRDPSRRPRPTAAATQPTAVDQE